MSPTVIPFRSAAALDPAVLDPTHEAHDAAVEGSVAGTVERTVDGTVDADMALVATNIGRFGMHLVHVGEGCSCGDCTTAPLPPDQRFGYTVGLTGLGHPELLVRGLGARETAVLLDRWGDTVLGGHVFDAGHLLCEGPGGTTWELVPVHHPSETLRWAARYYRGTASGALGTGLSALELIPARRPCPCDWCGRGRVATGPS